MAKGRVGIRKQRKPKGYFDYYIRRKKAADAAVTIFSYKQTARLFGLSMHQVRYWVRRKRSGKTATQGGSRYRKLTDLDKLYLVELGKRYPQSNLSLFNKALRVLTGTTVTNATISRYFTQIGWSYHCVEHKQRLKYTQENLMRYLHHIIAMPDIARQKGLEKIKYLDEVHFVSKQMQKQKGIGPRGRRIVVRSNCSLTENYSMTLMTNLQQDSPYNASLRAGSNTQYDFSLFICRCIRSGYLVDGDILVMDNASVHGGEDTFDIVYSILEKVGVTLFLLPAYSPELNPAEYIFAYLKNSLRCRRDSSLPLWNDIVTTLNGLTKELVTSMYLKCIYEPKMG